jgi:hypothetical protein
MTDIPSSIWNFFSGLPLIPSSKSASEAWLSRGELWLVIFAAIIIVGLGGEYLAERRAERDERSWIPPRQRNSWNWKHLFAVVVVISIVGEFFSDAIIWVSSAVLQTISDGEIAAAKLELEKIKNPRVIKNIFAVADKLRKYPNIKYWIVTETADQDPISEQIKLSQQIRRVFDEAKWVQESHLNRYSKEPMPPFSAVSDPGCLVSTAGDEKSLRVMKAVIEAFKPDFECDEYVDFNIISDSVLIHVGLHGGK